MGEVALACPSCEAGIATVADACPPCGASLLHCGGYRIEALLGQGRVGAVYAGRRRSDQAPVAVKIFALSDAADWSSRDLFESSTRVLQGLHHPLLPKVYAFEQDERGRLV